MRASNSIKDVVFIVCVEVLQKAIKKNMGFLPVRSREPDFPYPV